MTVLAWILFGLACTLVLYSWAETADSLKCSAGTSAFALLAIFLLLASKL